MKKEHSFTLINQQTGNLAFKLFYFEDNSPFDHLLYNNFYSLIWVEEGSGLLRVDSSECLFEADTLFAFSPYQPFMFSSDQKFKGVAVQFHSDFYCIHKFAQETNASKLIFDRIYQQPFMLIDPDTKSKLKHIIEQFKEEFSQSDKGNYDLLIPNLIMFLVTISRRKEQMSIKKELFAEAGMPFILKKLEEAVEKNYKKKHAAGEYAELLNISPNTLGKIVKQHFNKTITQLISERIIIEAKRELYLTNKTIKEIAWELGYLDEFYFSRFFKINSGTSPQQYRDTVGFGKAEMN